MIEFNKHIDESFDFGDMAQNDSIENNEDSKFFDADKSYDNGVKEALYMIKQTKFNTYDPENFEIKDNKLYYNKDFTKFYFTNTIVSSTVWNSIQKDWIELEKILDKYCVEGTKIHLYDIVDQDPISIHIEPNTNNFPRVLDFRRMADVFALEDIKRFGFQIEIYIRANINIDIKQIVFKNMDFWEIYNDREDPKGEKRYAAQRIDFCDCDGIHSAQNKPGIPYEFNDACFEGIEKPTIINVFKNDSLVQSAKIVPVVYNNGKTNKFIMGENNKVILENMNAPSNNIIDEAFDFDNDVDLQNDEHFFEADTSNTNLEKIKQLIESSNICYKKGTKLHIQNNKLYLEIDPNHTRTFIVFDLIAEFYEAYSKIMPVMLANGYDKIECVCKNFYNYYPEMAISGENMRQSKLDYSNLCDIFDFSLITERGFIIWVDMFDKSFVKLKGLNIHQIKFENDNIDENIVILEDCKFDEDFLCRYGQNIVSVPKKYKIIYDEVSNNWIVILDKGCNSAPTSTCLVNAIYNSHINTPKNMVNEKYSLISNNEDTSMTTLADAMVEFITDPRGMECDNDCHRQDEESKEEFMWFTKKHLYNYAREKKIKFSMPEWMHNFEVYLEKNDDPDYAGAYAPEADEFDEISQTVCPTIMITDGDFKKGRLHEILMHELRHAYDGWINHFKKGKTKKEFLQSGYKCLETNKHMTDIEHTNLEPCPMYKEYDNKGVKFNDDIFKNENYIYYMYCTIFYYVNFTEKNAYLESFTDIIRRQLNRKKETILQEIDKAQNEKRVLLDIVSVTPYNNSLYRKYKCYEYFLENPKKIAVRAMTSDLIDKVTEQMVKQFSWVVDFEPDTWYDILEKANNDKLLPLVKSQVKKMQRIYFELIEELKHSNDEA